MLFPNATDCEVIPSWPERRLKAFHGFHVCILEDTKESRKIGLLEVQAYLYILRTSVCNIASPDTIVLHVQTLSKAQFDLWHFCFDHVPHDKLLLIHNKSPFRQSVLDHKERRVSYFAKQK